MKSDVNPPKNSPNGGLGKKLMLFLAILVALEALLVGAGAVYFLSQIFVSETTDLAGAIVIFAITAIIAVGLCLSALGTLKSKRWTRGAVLTWQILQIAVATSFLQGLTDWQPVGWLLITLSIATLVTMFSRPATSQIEGPS